MNKIKKGDSVIVIAGKHKGAKGSITRVLDNDRVIIEGVNMVKKHVKPNPQAGVEGGVVEKEAALHVSNIAIFNGMTKKADRVGFKTLEDGRKVRVFRSNQEMIDS